MEDKTLVSICVISYNSSEFVLETLESAKKQSYNHIELIISDDGSKDDTVELCKKWLTENGHYFLRTELITTSKNTGIPANCNRALGTARGEWIKLIAADDILLDDCIKHNLAYIQKNPETQILFSAMHPFFVENGKKKFLEPVSLSHFFLNLNADEQFIEIIFGKMPGVTPTLFIAKKLYEKLGYYDEEFKLAEDYPFWLKCTSNQHRFVSTDRLTVQYRLHNKSAAIAKVVNGRIFKDRMIIFKQHIERITATDDGKTQFVDYYKNNYYSFIRFCSESENLQLLENVKKTGKISNLFFFSMKKYILTFSKNDFLTRLLRSFYYRVLIIRLEKQATKIP